MIEKNKSSTFTMNDQNATCCRHTSCCGPDRQFPVLRAAPKVGRNDLCPYGSGCKFKKCCGKHTNA